MRSAAASVSTRSTCRSPTGTAPSNPTAASASACAMSADYGRRSENGSRGRGPPERRALQQRVTMTTRSASLSGERSMCPKCGCDDPSMLEQVTSGRWFCNNCSHDWVSASQRSASLSGERPPRFSSLDDLVARSGLRRDELVTLADIGALNAFGYDRRSALWQAERAGGPGGELFPAEHAEHAENALRETPHAPLNREDPPEPKKISAVS